jgi:hypothetical protein
VGISELFKVETTVTDADVTLVTNTRNVLTVSGLTALRTALFPAGVVDDVIEVELATDAPTDYELIIAGDTGVSMRLRKADAVTAAELTRLFIRGEAMRFVHDGTDWVCTALDDGRIPSYCSAWLSTAADNESPNVFTPPTDKGGAWTLFEDNAELTRLATSEVRIRRANTYELIARGMIKDYLAGAGISAAFRMPDSSLVIFAYNFGDLALAVSALAVQKSILNADDLIQYVYRGNGNRGLHTNKQNTYFSVLEQF